jgi:hypothetical protein
MRLAFHLSFSDCDQFKKTLESALYSHQLENEFGIFRWQKAGGFAIPDKSEYTLTFKERCKVFGLSWISSIQVILQVGFAHTSQGAHVQLRWRTKGSPFSTATNTVIVETTLSLRDLICESDTCLTRNLDARSLL